MSNATIGVYKENSGLHFLTRVNEHRTELIRKDVLAFAWVMEQVLSSHDDRPGWENEEEEYLLQRLQDEYNEVIEAYNNNEKDKARELVDLANFCMMLYCNSKRR